MLKKIFNEIFLIFVIVFGILSFAFPTPDSQYDVMFRTFGSSPQTMYDTPTIFVWAFILIFIILLGDSFWINQQAYHSDFMWCAGLDHNLACIGADIEKQTVGDWCWLRTGGIKEFPIRGNHVVFSPTTHTHKINNYVISEAHSIPDTPLTFIPAHIKPDVRQRRSGILGADICSGGFLSSNELLKNNTFNTNDYKDVVDSKELGLTYDTASFIETIRDANRDLNMKLELVNGENNSISMFLANITSVGKSVFNEGNKSMVDKVFGR